VKGQDATRARLASGLAQGALLGFLVVELSLSTLVSYAGDTAVFVPVAAAAGALLALTPARRLLVLANVVLGAAFLLVAFGPVVPWMAEGLPRRDPLRPADAVFVLGSRVQRDGDPTTDALTRLVHGLELVTEKRAPRLILSEQPGMPAYAPIARGLMKRLGLEAELLTVGPALNTRGEAQLVAELFRQRGWHTALIVTSPTHSRRAALAFEGAGLDVVSSPSWETRFDFETLDRPGDRLQAFGNLLHERVGIWWYRRRGFIRG
jgi:uncharacterized SAM-binding protein YcdF (DUF218 family)